MVFEILQNMASGHIKVKIEIGQVFYMAILILATESMESVPHATQNQFSDGEIYLCVTQTI